MAPLRDYTRSEARPLPVVILADVSGSMGVEGKIEALNQSMREMISTFAGEDDLHAEIQVCVFTFGQEAQKHIELAPAKDVEWKDMQASGLTPMGRAMELAADLIEDRNVFPGNGYTPAVVLMTDGHPTDNWQNGVQRLTLGRAKKAERIALAIGSDADESMLAAFLANPQKKVFHAEDARQIRTFLNWFTMSVTARSRSAEPGKVPEMGDPYSPGTF